MSLKSFIYTVSIWFIEFVNSLIFLLSLLFYPLTKRLLNKILTDNDIQVNGTRSWDPKVKDKRFYYLLAKYSYIGLIVGYINGYVECEQLHELMKKIYASKQYKIFCYHPSIFLRSLIDRYFFSQSEITPIEEESKHLYASFEAMNTSAEEENVTLSTGYWRHENEPEKAFIAKFDLIARKLKLKPGMRVLDLGCGDGTFCKYLAEKYDAKVTGVNICEEALKKARVSCRGLNVTFKVMDARHIQGVYDRITCIGMIEHLGVRDWKQLFSAVHRCLVDDGIFLLEATTVMHSFVPTNDGLLKTAFNIHCSWCYYMDVLESMEDLFVVEDIKNLRGDFSKTVLHWIQQIDKNWEKMVNHYGLTMTRAIKGLNSNMFGMVEEGYMQIYQFVLSKNGLITGYQTAI